MDFTVLLSFEQSKILELIHLLQQKEELFSIADLANRLLVSQKTLVGYLKKIQVKIQRSGEANNCRITFLKGGWMTYYERDDCATERFRVDYLRNIPELYILKKLLQRQLNIEELQLFFQISESCIRKKIQKIQKWLKHYQIYLRRKNFHIVGNEWQIRRLYLKFYSFLQEAFPFESRLAEDVLYLTKKIRYFFEMNVNMIRYNQLVYLIFIVSQRSQQQPIPLTEKWQLFLKNSQFFQKFQDCISPHSRLALNEQMYLFLMIEALFGSYFGRNTQRFFIHEYTQAQHPIYQATLFVMRQIKINFNQCGFAYCEKNFCSFLSTHLHIYLLQEVNGRTGEPIPTCQACYPITIKQLTAVAQQLQELFPDFSVVATTSLALSYFYKISKLVHPLCYEKKYFLCLITDFSIEKEQMLGDALLSYFQQRKNITVIYGEKAASVNYAHLFIVSHLLSKTLVATGKPILFLPEQMDEQFFHRIEALLNE